MNWIDIGLLIIIVWFAYKGLRNGLIGELTSFLALILAIWIALKYSNFTQELLQQHLSLQGDYLPVLSLILTFLVVLILVSLIGKIITKILDFAQLGFLNRLLGGFFALLKVGIILSLFVNGLDRMNTTYALIPQETINNSYLYNPLNDFSEKIYKFCGANFDTVSTKIKEITQ